MAVGFTLGRLPRIPQTAKLIRRSCVGCFRERGAAHPLNRPSTALSFTRRHSPMTESQVSPPVFTPLPDLCRLPVVLGVMLVGQLMVITYVLSLGPIDRFDWEMLALLTLYVQWIDLLTLAVLCQVRRWYSRYLFPRGLSNDASQMGDESALMRSRSVMVLYGLSFVAIIAVVVTCNTAAQWLYPVHREGWSLSLIHI